MDLHVALYACGDRPTETGNPVIPFPMVLSTAAKPLHRIRDAAFDAAFDASNRAGMQGAEREVIYHAVVGSVYDATWYATLDAARELRRDYEPG